MKKDKDSKKLLGRFESLSMFGLLISAPLGGLLAYFIGLRMTMALESVPIFIAFLIALSIKETKLTDVTAEFSINIADLLIEVKGKKFSLLDLIGLESELKKKLGKRVDLLTYNGINHLLRERILNEEVRII